MQAQASQPFQMGMAMPNQMAARPPLQDWNGNSGNGSNDGGINNNHNNCNKRSNNYNNNSNNGNNNNNNGGNDNKNYVKRFENWNYCHSCGFDISSTHSSGNCPKQLMGHQSNATRQNTMNSNGKAGHKNILPSAAGKVCGDVLSQQRAAKRNMGGNRGNYVNQNNNNKFQ